MYDNEEAFAAGWIKRFGPPSSERQDWPVWKRAACRLTPAKQRWRWSEYAPVVKFFRAQQKLKG
jgi:hypothetical protein